MEILKTIHIHDTHAIITCIKQEWKTWDCLQRFQARNHLQRVAAANEKNIQIQALCAAIEAACHNLEEAARRYQRLLQRKNALDPQQRDDMICKFVSLQQQRGAFTSAYNLAQALSSPSGYLRQAQLACVLGDTLSASMSLTRMKTAWRKARGDRPLPYAYYLAQADIHCLCRRGRAALHAAQEARRWFQVQVSCVREPAAITLMEKRAYVLIGIPAGVMLPLIPGVRDCNGAWYLELLCLAVTAKLAMEAGSLNHAVQCLDWLSKVRYHKQWSASKEPAWLYSELRTSTVPRLKAFIQQHQKHGYFATSPA